MQLREHQLEGVEVLAREERYLLADKMGLGKTATVLKTLERLNSFPTLVVATKSALGVWEYEAKQWLGMPCAIYSGPPHKRQEAWNTFIENRLPFLITNYAFIEEVAKRRSKWLAIVADEIHLGGLLNHRTQTYKKFKKLLNSKYLFLVTGSPMRKSPADLYAPLHLIAPKDFPSYWAFVNKHCVVLEGSYGKEIEPIPAKPTEFRSLVRKYMLRRTEVPGLPDKFRWPLPIYMTPKQEALYKMLTEEMITEAEGQLILTPTVVAQLVRLRQLLVSPLLLGFSEKGAILEVLPDIVESEFREGNSVAIFTPFRGAVSLFAEELQKVSDYVGCIVGGMDHRKLTEAYTTFQTYKSPRKVMICTVASSTSFTIHAASAAYFAGCEWDFNTNEQAEQRLHRQGQTKTVRVYYMMHRGTIDEYVVDTVITKKASIDVVLGPEQLLPINYASHRITGT